jgi:hypothetical protein
VAAAVPQWVVVRALLKFVCPAAFSVFVGFLLNVSASYLNPDYAPRFVRWGWWIVLLAFAAYTARSFGLWRRLLSWSPRSSSRAATILRTAVVSATCLAYAVLAYLGINALWNQIGAKATERLKVQGSTAVAGPTPAAPPGLKEPGTYSSSGASASGSKRHSEGPSPDPKAASRAPAAVGSDMSNEQLKDSALALSRRIRAVQEELNNNIFRATSRPSATPQEIGQNEVEILNRAESQFGPLRAEAQNVIFHLRNRVPPPQPFPSELVRFCLSGRCAGPSPFSGVADYVDQLAYLVPDSRQSGATSPDRFSRDAYIDDKGRRIVVELTNNLATLYHVGYHLWMETGMWLVVDGKATFSTDRRVEDSDQDKQRDRLNHGDVLLLSATVPDAAVAKSDRLVIEVSFTESQLSQSGLPQRFCYAIQHNEKQLTGISSHVCD